MTDQMHGHAKGKRTPEYRAWHDMKQRCQNPHHREWKNYGKRGITICPRWQSFKAFYIDMGPRPSPGHSLDRINNESGSYEPSNCRWADKKTQDRNKRTNHFLEFDGHRATLTEWAERLGLSRDALSRQIKKGVTVKDLVESRDSLQRKNIANQRSACAGPPQRWATGSNGAVL